MLDVPDGLRVPAREPSPLLPLAPRGTARSPELLPPELLPPELLPPPPPPPRRCGADATGSADGRSGTYAGEGAPAEPEEVEEEPPELLPALPPPLSPPLGAAEPPPPLDSPPPDLGSAVPAGVPVGR